MNDRKAQKASLRERLRQRRRVVAPSAHTAASRAVCAHLDPLLDEHDVFGCFASVENEIDLSDFVERALERDKRVYFPRVIGPGAMEFVPVESLDELQPGAFDIPEPVGPPDSHSDEIEVFLVPAVAFDHRGTRLGFGGGFYDRALGPRLQGEQRPVLIGIGYDWQLLDEELPRAAWDVPMDQVVTDVGTVDCDVEESDA